jgi:hypothetical protein
MALMEIDEKHHQVSLAQQAALAAGAAVASGAWNQVLNDSEEFGSSVTRSVGRNLKRAGEQIYDFFMGKRSKKAKTPSNGSSRTKSRRKKFRTYRKKMRKYYKNAKYKAMRKPKRPKKKRTVKSVAYQALSIAKKLDHYNESHYKTNYADGKVAWYPVSYNHHEYDAGSVIGQAAKALFDPIITDGTLGTHYLITNLTQGDDKDQFTGNEIEPKYLLLRLRCRPILEWGNEQAQNPHPIWIRLEMFQCNDDNHEIAAGTHIPQAVDIWSSAYIPAQELNDRTFWSRPQYRIEKDNSKKYRCVWSRKWYMPLPQSSKFRVNDVPTPNNEVVLPRYVYKVFKIPIRGRIPFNTVAESSTPGKLFPMKNRVYFMLTTNNDLNRSLVDFKQRTYVDEWDARFVYDD